jgi:Tat protein secretion system quality control protein TatD with DNase activity
MSPERKRFNDLAKKTSYIGEIGLDFSREGIATKTKFLLCFDSYQCKIIAEIPQDRLLTEIDGPFVKIGDKIVTSMDVSIVNIWSR